MNARAVRSQCPQYSRPATNTATPSPSTASTHQTLINAAQALTASLDSPQQAQDTSMDHQHTPSKTTTDMLPLTACSLPFVVIKDSKPQTPLAATESQPPKRPSSVWPATACDKLHPSKFTHLGGSPGPGPSPTAGQTAESSPPVSVNNTTIFSHSREHSGSSEQRQSVLKTIVEVATVNYYHSGVDASLLPASHPTLARMLIGYDALQRRRDTNFNRVRDTGNGLSPTRVFVESNTVDIYEYWFALRAEIEWVAEMLSSFDGYAQLSSEDKATLFKNFWILFIILERSFDSYRVCGTDLDDYRIVNTPFTLFKISINMSTNL